MDCFNCGPLALGPELSVAFLLALILARCATAVMALNAVVFLLALLLTPCYVTCLSGDNTMLVLTACLLHAYVYDASE